jgi:cobalt-zinc-cadmium efflux system outer membrane protein
MCTHVRRLSVLCISLLVLMTHVALAQPAASPLDTRVQQLLAADLTADSAVQIALLRNPQIKAVYADVGVSEADLVTAGLLKNPLFDAMVRFPNRPGLTTNTQFGVSIDFLDVFLRAARRKVASAQLAQTQYEAAWSVAGLTRDVRAAYYTLQASQQAVAVQQIFVEAAQAAAELAQRQYAAGTASALDVARQQAAAAQTEVELENRKAEASIARRALAASMGLPGSQDWHLAATLPPLPDREPERGTLQARAERERQDVAAARLEPDILAERASLERRLSWGEVRVGVSREQDPEHFHEIGPTLQLGLPIFNRNQGEVRRLEAQNRKASLQLEALTMQVRNSVDDAYDRLLARRRAVELYQQKILPLRERIVSLERLQYNSMLLGVYVLLQARQDEIAAVTGSLEALRDYWIARADLERAVGGPLEKTP